MSWRCNRNRSTRKCDYNHYTPPSLNGVIDANPQFFFGLPNEISVLSLKDSYFEIKIKTVGIIGNENEDIVNERTVNLNPILFSEHILTTSAKKYSKTLIFQILSF